MAPRRQIQTKRDGRSLDHETLEELRLRAVERIEAGERIVDVACLIGFDQAVVSRWMSRYRKEGVEALHSTKAPGPTPKLDDEQVALIRRIIVSTSPPVWHFPTVTWTRSMVGVLIEKGFGVNLGEEAIGRMMRHRMGLPVQRTVRRAFEADEARVKAWLEAEYPTIREQAKEAGGWIFFAGESAVRSDCPIDLISAISPEGELRWMEVEGRMNGARFVEFLRGLIKGREKPIYVIVDGHPAHEAKEVRTFLEKNGRRLKLFVLPPGSPEPNLDELVWADLKHHTIARRAFRVVGELRAMLREHMERRCEAHSSLDGALVFDELHVRYVEA